jgi:hypothetical protein
VTGPRGPDDDDDRRTLTNLLAAIAAVWVTRVLDKRRELEP